MKISTPKRMSTALSSFASDICKEEKLCAEAPPAVPDYSAFLEDNQSALQERMKHLSDTFQEYLMYLMESRGLSNTEVYKRAIITKQLFSKIKRNSQYHEIDIALEEHGLLCFIE